MNTLLYERMIAILFLWTFSLSVLSQSEESTNLVKEEIKFEEIDFDNPVEDNLKLIEEQLIYYKKNGDWVRYINSLTGKSLIYYYSADYENFIPHSEMTFELASQKKIPTQSQTYISTLTVRTFAMELMGDYASSIKIQKECIPLCKDATAKFSVFETLGVTYEIINDYEEAIRYYNYALNIFSEASELGPHEIGRVLRNTAHCYEEKGDFHKALNLYHQSFVYLNQLPPKPFYLQTMWYAYQDLSDLYLKKENMDSAMYYSVKAIAILQTTANIFESYKTYINHGNIWMAKKDPEKAIESYEKALALAIGEYKIFDRHPSFAICLNKKAEASLKKADYLTALKLCQEALQKIAIDFDPGNNTGNPKPDKYIIKQNGLDILATKAEALFGLYEKEGKLENLQSAHQTYSDASELILSIRQDYLAEGSKHTLAKKALPVYEKAIETALKLYEISEDKQYLESAYSIAESNKSTLLYESIKNNMAKGFAGIPDSLLDRENELVTNRNFYQKLIKEERQKKGVAEEGKIKKWEKLVFELNAKLEKLVGDMEANYPDYLEQKNQTAPATFTDARQALPDDRTALVEYMIGEENGYVFFITKNDFKIFKVKDKGQLAQNITQLRALITAPPNSEKFGEEFNELTGLAHTLYSQLLAEGLEKLPQKINRLIIIPDDMLCYLPFEILLREKAQNDKPNYSPKALAYFMEDYQIGYQYSASLMTAHKSKATGTDTGNFIGFAPTFEGGYAVARTCSDDMLYSLQCNEREVTEISELMGGEAMIAANAGLDFFTQNASNYRILHLATHACVDDSDIGLNKIYLADGDLTQYELNNLHLNAELTVLSACNTGMGKFLKGEGMISLTRSFMMAGSKSVLTSLWSVDDCATSDIMVNYYKCLKKGMPKDKAIAEAKLAYLKTADRNNSHPYYWGAFVQFGEVQPLMKNKFIYWILITVLLLAGAGLFFLKNEKRAGV